MGAYLMPPKRVYRTTPTGKRKHAAAVGIPVKELTTALPPVNNMAVTLCSRLSVRSVAPVLSFLSLSNASPTDQGHSQDVSKKSKNHIRNMRRGPISSSNDLQESVRIGSFPLQLNRKGSEQQDLDRCARGIPERTGYTILVSNSGAL